MVCEATNSFINCFDFHLLMSWVLRRDEAVSDAVGSEVLAGLLFMSTMSMLSLVYWWGFY